MAKKKKAGLGRHLPALNANAFIIGNGTSRKDLDLTSLKGNGNIYGCNWFFKKEFMPDVIVASDEPMTKSILKDHMAAVKQRQFFTWFPKPGSGAKKATCPEKFAAGPMATWVACDKHQAKAVFLIGMDFFGFGSKGMDNNGKLNNLYAGEKHYKDQSEANVAPTYRNWQRRFHYTIKNFPNVEFYHVNPFEGNSPERLRGFPNFHQITWENLQEHLNNGAELVDLLEKTEEDVKLCTEQNPTDLQAVIERQLVGQENTIFMDVLSVKQVVDIRCRVAELQKQQSLPKGAAVVEILGMPIQLPYMSLPVKDGHIQWPEKDQVAAMVRIEQQNRVRIMEAFWQRHNFQPTRLQLPSKEEIAARQPKRQANTMMPPPPPPLANSSVNIPPPPPPVFQ